ncbi:MAG TPA: DJ-1/PfpI family protein [Anaerolineae bacterium]|nr:DJ-1/PfpI family protein [Anaerolineae bacterium]
MKIAFVIFDGLTALDFIGVYDPVTRLKTMGFMPALEWDICARSQPVRDSTGLIFTPTGVGESLAEYDTVIVPGGFGTRALVKDEAFLEWLRTAERCQKVSVCTGALLLAAAGFLKGKKATTHPNAFAELSELGASVLTDRVVDAEGLITARGVTAAIDLGLYLVEKWAGREVKERIRVQMDYQTS